MKNLLKLTCVKTNETILIGSRQIIQAKKMILTDTNGTKIHCTEIKSVGAMVTTNFVKETPEQIYKQDNDE